MKYLSVAAIVKNENYYIEEWLDFHRQQGVEHFYIFDNESTDNISTALEKYDDVSVFHTPGTYMQNKAYTSAIEMTREESKWLALIDIDEFLFSVDGKISDKLKEYEEFGGVVVNEFWFGANGHKTKQANVLKTHTRRNPKADRHVKSVVQPEKVVNCTHPHYVNYKPGWFHVDETKEHPHSPHDKCFNERLCADILRINHYHCKSEEDYIEKMLRGRADCDPGHPLHFRHKAARMSVEDYAAMHAQKDNEVEDLLILEKYV